MSKKWFLTLIFPFLFVILSGFGYPQENVEKKTQSDSTTITLKFQNPNLKIVDERNLDLITKFIEERDASENAIAGAINQVSGYLPYMVENQERRYESAMDYLERTTLYSTNEIEQFIKQKRFSEMLASIVLITSLILAYLYIVIPTNWKSMDWRIFLTKAIGVTLISLLIYATLNTVLCSLLYPESFRFFTLINLSG